MHTYIHSRLEYGLFCSDTPARVHTQQVCTQSSYTPDWSRSTGPLRVTFTVARATLCPEGRTRRTVALTLTVSRKKQEGWAVVMRQATVRERKENLHGTQPS
jgi:hypothetical protein